MDAAAATATARARTAELAKQRGFDPVRTGPDTVNSIVWSYSWPSTGATYTGSATAAVQTAKIASLERLLTAGKLSVSQFVDALERV